MRLVSKKNIADNAPVSWPGRGGGGGMNDPTKQSSVMITTIYSCFVFVGLSWYLIEHNLSFKYLGGNAK